MTKFFDMILGIFKWTMIFFIWFMVLGTILILTGEVNI